MAILRAIQVFLNKDNNKKVRVPEDSLLKAINKIIKVKKKK